MSFQKQFEELSKQIHNLEKEISAVKNHDIIPLSFFSVSIDSLHRLKVGIHEIEMIQFNLMQEHLRKTEESILADQTEKDLYKNVTVEVKKTDVEEIDEVSFKEDEEPEMEEVKEIPAVEKLEIPQPATDSKVFLSDIITKKKLADFGKSLSLNERFMFQREIFQNNTSRMSQAMGALNEFDNLSDALNYLNSNFPIQWESEAGIIFRELLEKRFI